MAHFAFTVAAVTFIGMALRTAAQTTTVKPWVLGEGDLTDPWFFGNDPALYPLVCHTEPWDRTNPNTPADGPEQHICPCNYPYHHRQQMCCKPQAHNEGAESTWAIRAPFFYAAAGLSVEAHKSRVDGTMLCPCGYALNRTTNICHTLKDDKYEDRCPCGTRKNPANGACYYINGTNPNGPFPTEQWGECLDSLLVQLYFVRSFPKDWRQGNEWSNNICPCEYVWNKEKLTCCKLSGARSPFFYEAANDAPALPTTTGQKQLCACGYYQNDRDGYCHSIEKRKIYQDVCPCGWQKDPVRMACQDAGFIYPFGYLQLY